MDKRFCRHCGATVAAQAIACVKCGVRPDDATNFCGNCGKSTTANQVMCTACGGDLSRKTGIGGNSKSKMIAGLLAIFLGPLGIHKFYLGYTKAGVILLICSIVCVSLGASAWIPSVYCLVEGILYLTKSDVDFDQTYVRGTKEWL